MPRIWTAGSINHVIARGNRRQGIFADESDYRRFLAELIIQLPKYNALLYAYCLMPNHLHLLIKALGSLSDLMHRVLTNYALYINSRYDHVGHLFQGRFKNRVVADEHYLNNVIRYIHYNPVSAKLAKTETDWAWSSAREYEGSRQSDYISVIRGPSDPALDPADFEEDEGFLWNPAFTLKAILQKIESSAVVSGELIKSHCTEPRTRAARGQFIAQALAAGHRTGKIAAFLGRSAGSISQLAREPLSPDFKP